MGTCFHRAPQSLIFLAYGWINLSLSSVYRWSWVGSKQVDSLSCAPFNQIFIKTNNNSNNKCHRIERDSVPVVTRLNSIQSGILCARCGWHTRVENVQSIMRNRMKNDNKIGEQCFKMWSTWRWKINRVRFLLIKVAEKKRHHNQIHVDNCDSKEKI